jgi:N4-gp56 family major capsid protein
MPDASVSTSTTNFNKALQTLISKRLEELLRAPKPHLLADNFVKATHVAGSNGTMRFLNIPDLTVDAAEVTASIVQSEGEPNDTDDLAFGYEEFSTRQRMKTLRFTDVALLQSPQALLAEGAERLAEYVRNLLDKIAADKIVTGTNVIYAGTANTDTDEVTGADIITGALIRKAVALLKNGNVPTFGDNSYRGIVNPLVEFDLMEDTADGGWIDANRYSNPQALFDGELGKVAGVRFMSSSLAAVLADAGQSSNDVYSTTIFGPRFFAIGDFGNNETFMTPPGGHDDPGHQSALITWKGWADAVVLGEGVSATNVTDPRYIRIESGATLGSQS